MHEQVIELVGDDNEDVLFGKLAAPLLRVAIIIVLFLTTMITTDTKLCIGFNCFSLLLNQVLCWCNKHDLN